MTAVRERIEAAGLTGSIGLTGAAPWSVLSYQDHPAGSKEAIKTLFLREMIAAGVLINASHNVCFAHSTCDIAQVLAAYDRALDVVRDALDKGDIERRLDGQVIRPDILDFGRFNRQGHFGSRFEPCFFHKRSEVGKKASQGNKCVVTTPTIEIRADGFYQDPKCRRKVEAARGSRCPATDEAAPARRR